MSRLLNSPEAAVREVTHAARPNSPRPRPAGYRSVGNAITLVAATRRLLLVAQGSFVFVGVAVERRGVRPQTISAGPHSS
jgi:hypothetical protein